MTRLKQIEIDVDVNGAIEGHRRSFEESPNDILRRLLGVEVAEAVALEGRRGAVEPPGQTGERTTGRWTVRLGESRIAAANLKGAYRTLLLLLEERDPGFLDKFSNERARSRRFVARSPEDLYLASPKLAKQHAKPLTDGWFFDTNLSTDEVARRARIAARVSGLAYGRDVELTNNFQPI
jgi:negative regulator of replication initiation